MVRRRNTRGDFHQDTGLCDMGTATRDNKDGGTSSPYQCVIDASVVSGVLGHVCTDDACEVIGHLGGVYHADTHTVHVSHFTAAQRDPATLATDSVEAEPSEFVRALTEFSERGLGIVGWYHSHPRIAPFPSEKDRVMQDEFQAQVPYGVGLIFSPYMADRNNRETLYMNAFRVVDDSVVRVRHFINEEPALRPSVQKEMLRTLRTCMLENRAVKDRFRAATLESGALMMGEHEYQRFLLDLWGNSIANCERSIAQDLQNLKRQNEILENCINNSSRNSIADNKTNKEQQEDEGNGWDIVRKVNC